MKNQEPNLENCYNCIHFSVRELKNGEVKTRCEVSSLKVGDNICLRYKKELDDVESEENEDFFLPIDSQRDIDIEESFRDLEDEND